MTEALSRRHFCGVLLALLLRGLLGACDPTSTPSSNSPDRCELSSTDLGDRGTGRDAIPALTNPPLVGATAEEASYLSDDNRVIGLLVGETPLAVPHNILWHHEIVNLDDWVDRPIAVTYCPFTGSGLAFDREAVDGAEFGVSGLLLHENLVMYDRRENESLWPQMSRGARCGPETGTPLSTLPVIEMTWGHWRRLHPDTKVLSSETGYSRDYSTDRRPAQRPPSLAASSTTPSDEPDPRGRVLGLHGGQGLALPFERLDDGSSMRVVRVRSGASPVVVFWHRASQSAMAFQPRVEGQSLSFTVQNGHVVDTETQSTWTVDGQAVAGPKTGARLAPVATAYVAFWGAWAAFVPKTRLWTAHS